MESLSTDENGAKLNLANFKKLYKHYNDVIFDNQLNKLNRTNKFIMSNWHIMSQSYVSSTASTTLSPNTIGIYSITNGSTVIYNIDKYSEMLRNKLVFTDNSQLLKYIVEEFIQDSIFMANFEKLKDKPINVIRSELNNIYFKHKYNLPAVVNNNVLLSTFSF